MKQKFRILALSLAFSLLLSVSNCVFAAPNQHWAADTYQKWVNAGVFEDEATLAQIDAPVTRGELVCVLDEILDWGWDTMAENTFTDLMYTADGESYQDDMAFYTDILKAVGNGVIAGTDDGAIEPYRPVTRQDACVILRQAFQLPQAGSTASFADDDEISDYAKSAVAAVVARGYMGGKPGNQFDPLATITRGELCTILDGMAKDYPAVAQRAASTAVDWIYDKSTEITVATVDTYAGDTSAMIPTSFTYEGGWIETDENGKIITEPTGTKDLNIRLWLPEGTQPGDDVPVMLWTFGGSWILGDNTSISPFFVEYLTEHGIAVAALTYRYEHEACFPYSMYDLQAQIRYLKINAESLGIDGDNMGISGQSAGGYWAAQMAVSGNEPELQDPGYVTFEGDQLGMLTEIQYCGAQYGAFNMMNCADFVDWRVQDPVAAVNQHDRDISNDPNVMGTAAVGITPVQVEEAYRNGTDDPLLAMMVQRFIDGSPIFQVDENDPEFFFYHGTNDGLCPLNQAVEMYGAMRAVGIDCVLRVCEGMGHGAKHHPQYYMEMLDWMVDQAAAH